MSARPWFKVARGIHDHPRFARVELCEVACATWLFGHARHTPGDGLDVGQLRATYTDLVRAWRWERRGARPEEMVRRLLRRWSSNPDPMIAVEPEVVGGAKVGVVITVLRYADWQAPKWVRRATDPPTDPWGTPPTDQPTDTATDLTPTKQHGIPTGRDGHSDGPADGPADGPMVGGRDDLLLNRDDLRRETGQQRARAREAAADPRLSWEAVRDLWVRCRAERPWFYSGVPANLGGPHAGPIRFVLEEAETLAADVGVDDALAHVASVLEAFLGDRSEYMRRNEHPLAWLTKPEAGSTEPRWHQWAMRDPWYAARQSNSHHVAQSEAPPTSTTSEQAAQSRGHHEADPSLPTYSRATGEDADEVRGVLQQLVNDGLDAIKTGVLCRVGDDLALVFADDMDMLVSAKRVSRYLPDVACLHGAVEREQRGAA